MNIPTTCDVAIIGGGPGGTTAATAGATTTAGTLSALPEKSLVTSQPMEAIEAPTMAKLSGVAIENDMVNFLFLSSKRGNGNGER